MFETRQIDWLRNTKILTVSNLNNRIMKNVNEGTTVNNSEGQLLNTPFLNPGVVEDPLVEISSFGIVCPANYDGGSFVFGVPCPYDLDPNHEIGIRFLCSSLANITLSDYYCGVSFDKKDVAMVTLVGGSSSSFGSSDPSTPIVMTAGNLYKTERIRVPRLKSGNNSSIIITREDIENGGLLRGYLVFTYDVSEYIVIEAVILDYNVLNTVGTLPPNMQPIKFNGNML